MRGIINMIIRTYDKAAEDAVESRGVPPKTE
jgi:hypothetical protein